MAKTIEDFKTAFAKHSKVSSSTVKALVAAFQSIKPAAGADDAPREKAAITSIIVDATEAQRELAGKTLANSRFKDSFATLEELVVRARSRLIEVDKLRDKPLPGADLFVASVGEAGDDKVLETLTVAVDAVSRATEADRTSLLVDAYFICDRWLKNAAGTAVAKEASDAAVLANVEAIFRNIATTLSEIAGVSINTLPKWLEQHAGKGITKHGIELDERDELAAWMTENQREVFRVHVSGGRLKQYEWWTWMDLGNWDLSKQQFDLSGKKLVNVDSGKWPSDVIKKGYTGFVMSMGGDLYMSYQAPSNQKGLATYHSSYMAGRPVLMAGEMLVESGKVKRANPGSGHYRPPVAMLVRFLKLLEAQGIEVEEVADFEDKNAMSVKDFLEEHGDEAPDDAAEADHQVAMEKERHKLFLGRLFREQRAVCTNANQQRHTIEAELRKRQDLLASIESYESKEKYDLAAKKKRESDRIETRLKPERRRANKALLDLDEAAAELTDLRAKRAATTAALPGDPKPGAVDGYVQAIKDLLGTIDEEKKALQAAVDAIDEIGA